MSFTVTVTTPNVVGRVAVVSGSIAAVGTETPNRDAISPGETPPPLKLAAFTRAMELVAGRLRAREGACGRWPKALPLSRTVRMSKRREMAALVFSQLLQSGNTPSFYYAPSVSTRGVTVEDVRQLVEEQRLSDPSRW